MRKTKIALVLVLSVFLFSCLHFDAIVGGESATGTQRGPRQCSGMEIRFYDTHEAAYAALKAGEVDFLAGALTIPQYLDATSDVNILLAEDGSPCYYTSEKGHMQIPVALHWVEGESWTTLNGILTQIKKANEIWGCSLELVVESSESHTSFDPAKNKDCMINIWIVNATRNRNRATGEWELEKEPDRYISGTSRLNGGFIQLVGGDTKSPPDIWCKVNTLAHEIGHYFCLVDAADSDRDNIMCPDVNILNHSCTRFYNATAPKPLQDKVRDSTKGKKSHAIRKNVGKSEKDGGNDTLDDSVDLDSYYAFSWGGKLCCRLVISSFDATADCELGFYFESDNSLLTGMPLTGIDYFVGFNPALNQTIFRRYDAGWVELDPTGIKANIIYNWKDVVWPPVPAGIDFELPTTLLSRRAGKIISVQAVGHSGDAWDYAPDTGLASFLTAAQYGYSTRLAAICNMVGVGPENVYTFLNTYKPTQTGIPLKVGTVGVPTALNPLYSRDNAGLTVLNTVYQNLLNVAPYSIPVDQPWIAKDWLVDTWYNAKTGQNCIKVTYWLRADAVWVAPETGEPLQSFTAYDLDFSLWYKYAFNDTRNYFSFKDLQYTRIVDDHCIEIYFNTTNDRALYWSAYEISHLYRDRVLDPLCAETFDEWLQSGIDEHVLTQNAVQIASATLDSAPLTEGVDYVVRGDSVTFKRNTFVPLRDLTGTLMIDYWYPDIEASGYFLAGLLWNQTMYSIGPYYPIDIIPGSGGVVTLKCNPYFFLETPLFDVDWRWVWQGATRPRSGSYAIDIYDLVMVATAYGSTGTGTPSAKWFPGADLASPCGKIDIFDVVTLSTRYGQTYGKPP